MQSYLYHDRDRLTMSKGPKFMELRRAILRIREFTTGVDDTYWIKCLVSIRNADKKLETRFEFADSSRWAIGPDNAQDAFSLVVGDVFETGPSRK